MIDKQTIEVIVNQWLTQGDYFLVDVNITAGDHITVEIDHCDGVWIEDCAELSRYIQSQIGEEISNYELEVGSAGIGQPFKVIKQYINHIGKEVETLDANGIKTRGILKDVTEDRFTITAKEYRKEEGKKRPKIVEVDRVFNINEVKYTKYILKFK